MDGRLVLMLVALQVLNHHSSAAAPRPPNATAYTYHNKILGVEKVDLIEAEKYKLENIALVLECNASYPVEWIVHQTVGTDKQSHHLAYSSYELAETQRFARNFEDPSSYEYTAILETFYWLNLEYSGFKEYSPTHFTCKATGTENRTLQSHVYMTTYDGAQPLFSLEITTEYKSEYLDTAKTFDKKANCENGNITISPTKDKESLCLSCNGNELSLRQRTEYCYTVTQCKSSAARNYKVAQCLQSGNTTGENCWVPGSHYSGKKVYSPSLTYCYDVENSTTILFQGVFFGVLRGDVRDEFSAALPVYFNWNEVDPTKMLYIHPVGREKMIVGEDVTVKCEYSRFYLSHGSWFAIRHPGGRIEYIRAFEKRSCNKHRFSYAEVRETGKQRFVTCDWNVPEKRKSTFSATLRRKLEVAGTYELFCIGPVWNTTNWVNASLPITVTGILSAETPTVAISVSSGNGYSPVNVSPLEVALPTWNASFSLECNATFPIEWAFQYTQEEVRTTKETAILAETHRSVQNITDPDTYSYTALIKVECKGRLASISKFTCLSTQNNNAPRLQTHVHVTNDGNATVLHLDVSRASADYALLSHPKTEAQNCTAMLQYAQPEPYNICVNCPKLHHSPHFRSCRTPIECNSFFARNDVSNTCFQNGWKCEPWTRSRKPVADYNPKYGQCKREESGRAVAGLLFFGIAKTIPELDGRQEVGDEEEERVPRELPVYVNWWDVDPSKMVYLHPLKSHVLANESVEVTCEYSRFYFSLGSWFGIKRKNGDFQYFSGTDIRPCDTDAERAEAALGTTSRTNCNPSRVAERRGTFNATLTTKFEEIGSYELFCMGPVWNTTEWAKSSRFIVVDKWEPPKVLSVLPREPLAVGQAGNNLKCHFKGHPKPKIRWTTPPGIKTWNTTEDFSSHLDLGRIRFSHFGVYRCYAESLNQSDFGEFTFTPENRTVTVSALSGGAITGIVVVSLLLLLGVTGLIARMRETIAKQRKALRLLTDTEVKEFLEGNPEAADTDGSEYITNVSAIDALPYDKSYEIPLDRMVINYASSLGSGEYGLILKGKLRPQKSGDNANLSVHFRAYENAAMLMEEGEGSELPSQELEIAVKVCKRNLGIEPFKALLSEVKVMAYLGQNENILSMIGASTENIRNREIYIAEELCHNGSLDVFVKKHKKKYFNKVRRGQYFEDLQPPITNPSEESDLESPFSTTELIRWTRDVAAGVEYIHSKRVIHGDLALRNVLITKDFVAKVGDFGLSRRLGEVSIYAKTTECPLPWRSMAIESLLHLQFSVKSDMWSLGVTFWELFTLGSIPYQGLSHNSEFIKELENGTLRLPTPHLAPSTICDFLLMCWENVPEDRPSTVEIRTICDSLIPSNTSS